VTLDEISHMDIEDQRAMESILGISDPMDIFNMLDVDKSGSLGIEEVCDGIWQYETASGSLEMKRSEKKIDKLQIRMDAFETAQMNICDQLKFTSARAARTNGYGARPSHRRERPEATELSEPGMPAWAAELRREIRNETKEIRSHLHKLLKARDDTMCEGKENPTYDVSHPACDSPRPLDGKNDGVHKQLLLHGTRKSERCGLEVPAEAGNLHPLHLKGKEPDLNMLPEWDRHCNPPLSPSLRTDVAFASKPQGPPDSSPTMLSHFRIKSCRETI